MKNSLSLCFTNYARIERILDLGSRFQEEQLLGTISNPLRSDDFDVYFPYACRAGTFCSKIYCTESIHRAYYKEEINKLH